MRTLDDLINDRIVELGRGKVISKKDLANYPGGLSCLFFGKE